ncbi:hypothetical protein BJ944DRAFT_284496 [Cunninghamella echinulata]|nr:hypothetical protein BJ944DRAFT_284496 [Cunninghamella echinulata]
MNKVLLALATLSPLVLAVLPPPRLKGGCTIVGDSNVYCLGGASATSSPTYLNDHYVLKLNQDYNDLSSLSNGWQSLAPAPESNSEFVMAPSSSSSYFVNGGTGSSDGKPLLYQSLSYDTLLNKWNQLPFKNLTDSLGQARGSYGIINPSDKQVYIFGGYWDSSIGYPSANFSNTMLVMNPMTGTWNPSIKTTFGTTTSPSRIGHVLAIDGFHISVVGGLEVKAAPNGVLQWSAASMSSIPQYNTILSTWTNQPLTGDTPSPRSYHTLSPVDILNYRYILFGGLDSTSNQPVTDTLYSLDLVSNSWKKISTTDGPRLWGHSAVSYKSRTVLIMNGVDSNGAVQNNVNVFDSVTNQWQSSFSTSAIYTSQNGNTNNNGNNGGSSYGSMYGYSSSNVAVAGGISGGGFVLISLIGAALFLFVKKNETHQPVSTAVVADGHQLNTFNNGYAKVEATDYNQYPSTIPQPPPTMSTNVAQGGEAASYLQHHSNNQPNHYHQPSYN